MKTIGKVLYVIMYILLLPICIFIGLVGGFTGSGKKTHKKDSWNEEEYYMLTNYEKEEVKKGNYKPNQFTEPDEGDELDSDEYYYDDF